MPSAISAVIAACQCPAAARPNGAGPGDRGERLGEGRDARRGLAAAEMLAPGLRAEPELDQRRRGGRHADAGRRDQRVVRRGQRHGDDERREHQRDAAGHRLHLGAHDPAAPGSARWRPDRARPRRRWRARRGRRQAGPPPSPAPARAARGRRCGCRTRATASGRAAADREAASASARRARDRGGAASIPCAAARRAATRRRKPLRRRRCITPRVRDAGRGDGVLAEARREQRDRRRRAAAAPTLSTAASAVMSPSTARAGHHTTLSIAGTSDTSRSDFRNVK